jgi:LDH2 family malate/lactate/ureidoglycolate dehydrogenase
MPGERGFRTRARLLQEGIEIARKIRDALRRLSEEHLDHGGR